MNINELAIALKYAAIDGQVARAVRYAATNAATPLDLLKLMIEAGAEADDDGLGRDLDRILADATSETATATTGAAESTRPEPAAEAPPAPPPPSKLQTLETLRPRFQAAGQAGHRERLVKFLTSHGADRLPSLAKEHFEAADDLLRELGV